MSKKSQSPKRIRAVLQQSMEQVLPVQLRRSLERHETESGVVLEIGDEWMLLACLREGILLDGFVALRIDQLARAELKGTFAGYVEQHNAWPPARPHGSFSIENLRSIMAGGVDTSGVVSVYREGKYPGQLLIGVPVKWTKKRMWLFTIDPQCRWDDFLDRYKLKDITKVSFGGDYEKAVLAVGGPMPPSVPATDNRGKPVLLPTVSGPDL